MATYNISADIRDDGVTVLTVSFGEPAGNDQIVVDAVAALKALGLSNHYLIIVT